MTSMATWVERFEIGDYPMVCARSGQPADKVVPVEAARRADWPWAFLFVQWVATAVAFWVVDRDRLLGELPFATGHVEGISATWDKRSKIVVLKGVHPNFVAASKAQTPPDHLVAVTRTTSSRP